VCRERLILVKAAWQWAVKNNLVEANPWIEIVSRVKVPPKQMPKPFTRDEIAAIIQAFRTDKYYHYYGDYIEFLFYTGCRVVLQKLVVVW
jgi:integrase